MIEPEDFDARGWEVLAGFAGMGALPREIMEEIISDPWVSGKSSHGTVNLIHSFILSFKPKTVLEIGAHIGFCSVAIGAALKANGFGRSFHLEPAERFFQLLSGFIEKAGLNGIAIPVQRLSTDPGLADIVGPSVELIYIDADHSYSHALEDIRIADRLLAPNGLLFLDDVGDPISAELCREGRGGVRQALLDFAAERPDYKVMFFDHPFWLNPCGLAIACKQPAAAPAEVVKPVRKRWFRR